VILGVPKVLMANTDLNEIADGFYGTSTSSVANSIINAPSSNNGEVLVYTVTIDNNIKLQVFLKNNTSELYYRTMRTTWNQWKKIATT